LGQPKEIKPTVGAVGGDGLVTYSLYRGAEFGACTAGLAGRHRQRDSAGRMSPPDGAVEGGYSPLYTCGKFLIFNSIRGRYPFQISENKEVIFRFLILKMISGEFWLL
jgi:hypothetical protein